LDTKLADNFGQFLKIKVSKLVHLNINFWRQDSDTNVDSSDSSVNEAQLFVELADLNVAVGFK